MNSKIFFLLFFAIISVCALQCNSTVYEIVEIPDEPDTSKTVSSNDQEIKKDLEQPKQEIKEDIVNKESKENNIETNKNVNETKEKDISISFGVQIGAFSSERNAERFTQKARNNTQYDFYSEFTGGLYKVRYGNFANNTDAKSVIFILKDEGYSDSFVFQIIN